MCNLSKLQQITDVDLGLATVDGRADGRTDRQTDGWTDGRYQTYYLPCFAVDNDWHVNHIGDQRIADRLMEL